MTAKILQLRDYQSKADLARVYGETTMEQQAIGIVDYINGLVGHEYTETTGYTEMIPYHGEGIDGMYVAPAKDPA